MIIVRNETDERLVNVQGMTPEQWKLLSDEIMKQDQEDSMILERPEENLITTTETEDPEDTFWAGYEPDTGIATFYENTINEYLAGDFDGSEGSVILLDNEDNSELKAIIEELQAARKAFNQ